MNVKYDDTVRDWSEGFTLVQQATERLESVLGPSAGTVEAEWRRLDDEKGRALVTLRLRDFAGQVSAHFTPDELRSAAQTSFRMHRLWGDVLQARNEKHLEELTRSGGSW